MGIIVWLYGQRISGWGRTFLFILASSIIVSSSVLVVYSEELMKMNAENIIGTIIIMVLGISNLIFLGTMIIAIIFRIIFSFTLNQSETYNQVYKLTIIALIPYSLLSAIIMIIFKEDTLGMLLASLVPSLKHVISPIIDIVFIYGLTHSLAYLGNKTVKDDS